MLYFLVRSTGLSIPYPGVPPRLGYLSLQTWCKMLSTDKWLAVDEFGALFGDLAEDFRPALVYYFYELFLLVCLFAVMPPLVEIPLLCLSFLVSISMQCWPIAICWVVTGATLSLNLLYMMSNSIEWEPTLWYVLDRESAVEKPSSSAGLLSLNVITSGVPKSFSFRACSLPSFSSTSWLLR